MSTIRLHDPAANQQPLTAVLAPWSFLLQRGESPISFKVFLLGAELGGD